MTWKRLSYKMAGLLRNMCMHVCMRVLIFFGWTINFQYCHHFSKIVDNCPKLLHIAYNCISFYIISHAQVEDCMFEEGIHVPLLNCGFYIAQRRSCSR